MERQRLNHNNDAQRLNFAQNLSPLQIQELETTGASEVTHFSHQGRHYIVVTSSTDSGGETRMNTNMYQWDNVANRWVVDLPPPATPKLLWDSQCTQTAQGGGGRSSKNLTPRKVHRWCDTFFLTTDEPPFWSDGSALGVTSQTHVCSRFSRQPVQQLPSHGAQAVDVTELDGGVFLAIANSGDAGQVLSPAM